MENKRTIQQHIDLFERIQAEILEKNGGIDVSDWGILNTDECGIARKDKLGRIVIPKEHENRRGHKQVSKMAHITMVNLINSKGTVGEPMIIVTGKNKTKNMRNYNDSFLRGTRCPFAVSESGYVNDTIFEVDVVPWIIEKVRELRKSKGDKDQKLWVLLTLDQFGSHIKIHDALKQLRDNKIDVYGFPSHCSACKCTI